MRKHLHELSDKFGRGTNVYVKNNDVNGALRKFKRKVQDARVFQDLKDREHPITKGQARRMAKSRAIQRVRMQKIADGELDS